MATTHLCLHEARLGKMEDRIMRVELELAETRGAMTLVKYLVPIVTPILTAAAVMAVQYFTK